jgi:hypothetical protein
VQRGIKTIGDLLNKPGWRAFLDLAEHDEPKRHRSFHRQRNTLEAAQKNRKMEKCSGSWSKKSAPVAQEDLRPLPR